MTTPSRDDNWYGPSKGGTIMHPDLEWLARNVREWPKFSDSQYVHYIYKFDDQNGNPHVGRHHPADTMEGIEYTYAQWESARRELGIEISGISDAEEDEYLQEAYDRLKRHEAEKYSAYFKDVRHIDTLDVYRVIDLFGCEKHGHPISHAVKKLLLSGARTGGKDVEADVREAIDSATRWLEMQEENRRAL